jgi:tRNA A-37 threonylcarbamoyl transferase component Bud32
VTAHLDVTGDRGDAIRRVVGEQLGLEVLEVKPFGLEGSGGSTPLRMKVAGDPDQYVFAKLYSQVHLRSDRWYKVGRTILYGSLEDEVRFTSVRRLVEYEDYIQRVMRDAGVSTAAPLGIVEITPEREYLMVSEFLERSQELTDADIDDDVIDEALGIIRCMWDAGLAHRDIKPANVMLSDGRVVLIDVAFGTVRPSPWRQAVDLANMMLILGLRTDAQRVYERALLRFAPEDIAEAFAATRSITLPSQSRSSLTLLKKEQGIDVVEQFREIAPYTEPISIQRWSPRRVRLAAGAAIVAVVAIVLVAQQVLGNGLL